MTEDKKKKTNGDDQEAETDEEILEALRQETKNRFSRGGGFGSMPRSGESGSANNSVPGRSWGEKQG